MPAMPSSQPSIPAFRHWPMVLAAALLLMTCVAYLPVIVHGGYIWDDPRWVTANPLLRTGQGLWRVWFDVGSHPQYYPLVLSALWVEFHLWGLDPLGYHLVNVVLHATSAMLLWRLLRRLDVPGAWCAAALFALHPVHVESVAWVTELKNVLSGLFYFLAFTVMVDWFGLGDRRGGGAWRWGLGLVLSICAVLSKTVTCTFPAAVLLVVWWQRGRLVWRDVLAMGPFLVFGVTLGMITVRLEKALGALGPEYDLSFFDRVCVAGRALWFYVGKLLWPVELIFTYPRWEIDAARPEQWLWPVAAVLVMLGLFVFRARLGRGPVTAVLFFAGTLFPALGFFNVYPMRFSFVADHFQYLASVGMITLFTAGVARWCQAAGAPVAKVGLVVCLVVLVLFGVKTWSLGKDYQSAETIFRSVVAHNPGSVMARRNLGIELANRGADREAKEQFEKAVELLPDGAGSIYNLGVVCLRLGLVDEAIGHYRRALALDPGNAEYWNDYGVALAMAGRLPEAAEAFASALDRRPGYTEAAENLRQARWFLAHPDVTVRTGEPPATPEGPPAPGAQ